MSIRLRNLPWMLLGQVPTLLTLALLGGIGWWGYVWDWKVPTLPKLLDPSTSTESDDREKKPDDDNQRASAKGQERLPLVRLRSKEAREEAGIQTQRVEERAIGDYVTAHGHIDYNQNHYAHLATRASGMAWRVFKQQGDDVKKGDVLALIASPELASLKFDLQQGLLTVKSRDAYYQRLKNGGRTTKQTELEQAEFAVRDARLALFKNQQSLQNLGLNVSLDDLNGLTDELVADRLRTLGIPDSLRQRLGERSLTNNLLPMYAPFDGMVVKREIVIGEMVTPATPQFHLADLRQLWICMNVRPENVARLKERQEVTFHLDGFDEDAPSALITWISAEVDEKTRTVPVRADVANPYERLRPNAFGDARILVDRQKHLTVPNEALQFDGKSQVVFVCGKSPTEFQPCRVQIGPRQGNFTVVINGIAAGQTVVAAGSHVLLSEMQKEHIAGDD